jgi:hypothetical protein
MNVDDEYEQLSVRYAQELGKSMKKTMEDVCDQVEGFRDLTQMQQEVVKRFALASVAAHFGGFNKKEKST